MGTNMQELPPDSYDSSELQRDGDKGYTAREKHVGDKTPENSGDLLLTSRH